MTFKDYCIIVTILVLAIGAGVVSAYQYYDSVLKDNENDSLNKELQQAQKEKIELSKRLEVKANSIIDKNSSILNKTAELIEKQYNLIKSAYGYGYSEISFYAVDSNTCQLSTENVSEFPLYEATIEVFDFTDIKVSDFPKANDGHIYISQELKTKYSKNLLRDKNLTPHSYRP